MKNLIAAAAVVALLAGTGAASAQYVSSDSNVKANSSADIQTSTTRHKRHHRATTGIETRDNNASARGSVLPGKDRLNSKAYTSEH